MFSVTLVHGGFGGGGGVSWRMNDSGVSVMVRASWMVFCKAGLDAAVWMYFRAIVWWRCLMV